jgi:hypothetical protein
MDPNNALIIRMILIIGIANMQRQMMCEVQ